MGFISGIKYKYSRTSAENQFSQHPAQLTVCKKRPKRDQKGENDNVDGVSAKSAGAIAKVKDKRKDWSAFTRQQIDVQYLLSNTGVLFISGRLSPKQDVGK